jgi:hypothetical protein
MRDFFRVSGVILLIRPLGFIHPQRTAWITESAVCDDSQFFATAALGLPEPTARVWPR